MYIDELEIFTPKVRDRAVPTEIGYRLRELDFSWVVVCRFLVKDFPEIATGDCGTDKHITGFLMNVVPLVWSLDGVFDANDYSFSFANLVAKSLNLSEVRVLNVADYLRYERIRCGFSKWVKLQHKNSLEVLTFLYSGR